jgi:hypothetical protein
MRPWDFVVSVLLRVRRGELLVRFSRASRLIPLYWARHQHIRFQTLVAMIIAVFSVVVTALRIHSAAMGYSVRPQKRANRQEYSE